MWNILRNITNYYFHNFYKALYLTMKKMLLVGDFNTEVFDNILSNFLYQVDPENLAKDSTPLIFLKLIIIQLSKTQQHPLVLFLITTNKSNFSEK